MKKYLLSELYVIRPLILAILLFPTVLYAQEETEEPRNPILEILESEDAIVEFDIPEDIMTNLNTAPGALRRPGTGNTQKKGVPGKMSGYRIQVFSDGNNPATLQSRAKARGNAIVARFPKYRGQVYSFSSSPNWYTRIGNFKTQEEANSALAELKRAFPSFAGEMRVVKSQITVLK